MTLASQEHKCSKRAAGLATAELMALRPRPCFSSNWLPWVVAAWQTVGTVGLVIRNLCAIAMENHHGSYLCIGKSTINGPLSIATLHYRSVPQSSFIQVKQWARNLGVTDLKETMFYRDLSQIIGIPVGFDRILGFSQWNRSIRIRSSQSTTCGCLFLWKAANNKRKQ